MSSIKQQLQADMKEAMKTRDKESLATIRLIIDKVQKEEKVVQGDLTEEQVIAVIQTFKKQTDDEIQGFEMGGKTEKVESLKKSLDLIVKYLPAQMTREELVKYVQDTIATMEGEIKMGAVMSLMKPLVAQGRTENKLVSEVVKEALQK